MMKIKVDIKKENWFILLFAVFLTCSCGPNEGVLKSGKPDPSQANAKNVKPPIEQDIESMRTAGFSYIFVLRRKDGGSIDSEDRGVIKQNTADAYRRIASDNGRAFVIGSKIQLRPENMSALFARFGVEDLSPAAAANLDTNANADK